MVQYSDMPSSRWEVDYTMRRDLQAWTSEKGSVAKGSSKMAYDAYFSTSVRLLVRILLLV